MLQRRTASQAPSDEDRSEQAKPSSTRRHQLTLKHREHMTVEGVVNVESFDRKEVILETDMGGMVIRGDDLHIKELSLEGSGLTLTGHVESIEYQGDRAQQAKGFLGRLFR